MKQALLVIVFFIATQLLYAQLPPRDSLVGKWICKEVKMLDDPSLKTEDPKVVAQMTNVFIKSVFDFNSNGKFNLKFDQSVPKEISQGSEFLNKNWTVDLAKGYIRIGEAKENIAQIYVKQNNNKTFFIIQDIPVLMLVERVR